LDIEIQSTIDTLKIGDETYYLGHNDIYMATKRKCNLIIYEHLRWQFRGTLGAIPVRIFYLSASCKLCEV